jgi:acetolactate decarboxylase
MKLKRYLWLVILLIALAVSGLPTYSQHVLQPHVGFQISTLGALNSGVYEGATTLAQLKQHGDFGLGTFEGLDGEMVVLNGNIYQIKADGVAYSVTDEVKTPFSVVASFQKEQSLRLTGQMSYENLQQAIDQQLPTQNLPYAICIQGVFPNLKVRSVPKQTLPFPPLSKVQQSIFELRNARGTLVGFRLPQYFNNVNAAGYHFHFITSDRKTGGHLLDGEFRNPIIDIEVLQEWQIRLPNHTAFKQASLK